MNLINLSKLADSEANAPQLFSAVYTNRYIKKKVASRCPLNASTNSYARKKVASRSQLYADPKGRSMVEMLGVLAIVGVLSVGAIAGYSKAMFKYRLNKQTEQIGFIVDYLIANQDNLRDVPYQMKDTLNKLGIVPDSMIKDNSEYAYDIFNLKIKLENHSRIAGSGYAVGIGISNSSQSVEICRNFIIMAKERADDVYAAYIQRGETDGTFTNSTPYFGNKIHGAANYLRNMDMVKIDNACKVCDETQTCNVFILIGYK